MACIWQQEGWRFFGCGGLDLRKNKKRGNKITKFILAAAAITLLAGCTSGQSSDGGANEASQSLIEEVQSDKGYIRVVSQEEYDFYKYFVERDLAKEIENQELNEKVKAYINEVNAVFYLGNKYGLYEPYSFDLLNMRMEQENRDRQQKLEAGEVVYGLEQFTLQTYYQYERSNLEADIIEYIEMNLDSEIVDLAEDYYNENPELFTGRESVTYEITALGVTQEVAADREQLNLLANADMNLADFLETAEVGDTYADMKDGEEREVLVTEISNTEPGFDNNRDAVIRYYIRYILLDELIDTVAQNNPVEFPIAE